MFMLTQFDSYCNEVEVDMSHIMRKPVFCIYEQLKCRSACTFMSFIQFDQQICYLLPNLESLMTGFS